MRRIGFSTGALAHADFRGALNMLRDTDVRTLELSALRQNELMPLFKDLNDLDLSRFEYIAVHAPSSLDAVAERDVVAVLKEIASRRWPIILHPDAVHEWANWQGFGTLLCVENMDKRKRTGRTAKELKEIFSQVPDASLCFDIGHARQVDSTMTEAYRILKEFGRQLQQVHLSEVNTASKHDRLSWTSIEAFKEVASLIPDRIPIILESPVKENEIAEEIDRARVSLTPIPEAMYA
jgi:hypothetical protein